MVDRNEILDVRARAKQWCEHSEHYHPDLADDLEKTIKVFEKGKEMDGQ